MSLARIVSLSFAFALVVVLSGGAASLYGIQRLGQTEAWVVRATETLEHLGSVRGLAVAEQNGSRGFALTGRDEFLGPRNVARATLPRDLGDLRRLTSTELSQQARILRLEALLDERAASVDGLIEARRSGGIGAAVSVVATGRGDALMRRVERVLAEMEDAERRLLSARVSADRAAARRAYTLAATASLATILVLLLERVLSKRAGAELRRANATLGSVIRAAPVAVAGLDSEMKIEFWNPAAERILGWKEQEVLGQQIPWIPADQENDFQELRQRVLGRGEVVVGLERKRKRRDGTSFDARLSIAPRMRGDEVSGTTAILEDVTEQKQAAEALRESEERFRLVFEEAPIGMALVSLDGHFRRVNQALCDIVGYTKEELTRTTFQAITHPDDRDAGAALVARLISGAIPRYQLSKRYFHKSGATVYLLIDVSVLRDPNGAPVQFISQMQDVTARKHADDALRASEARLRDLFDQAVEGIFIADLDGRYTDVNAAGGQMLGYCRDELVGKSIVDLIRPEDAPRLEGDRAFLLTPGNSRVSEWLLKRKDGTWIDVEASTKILADGRWHAFVRDVGERKRAQTALRQTQQGREESLRWLREVLDESPVGMLLIHGSVGEHRVEANRRAAEMIGHPIEDTAEEQLLLTPEGQPVRHDDVPSLRALRGERLGWTEFALRGAHGRVIPVAAGAAPVFGAEGSVRGAVVAFQDITQAKDLERLRAEWNSVVAHDLRQPLNVISLSVQLLAGKDSPPELRRTIERIGSAASRLDRMIRDLMDLSRLDVRQLKLSRTATEISRIVHASVERAAIGAPQQRFDVRVPDHLPWIDADADRLAQVLDNLLSNAVKYGRRGTPVVVEVKPEGDHIAVSVTNEGDGIAAGQIPHLFRRFHRTDEARRSEIKGIGLGLYITRELVEAHGGQITVQSTPGATTTFRFTLPIRRTAAA